MSEERIFHNGTWWRRRGASIEVWDVTESSYRPPLDEDGPPPLFEDPPPAEAPAEAASRDPRDEALALRGGISRPRLGEPDKVSVGMAVGGAGALMLGSLLPWAQITTGFGSISLSGMEGDGQITLLIGVVAALATIAYARGTRDVGALLFLAGLVSFAIAIPKVSGVPEIVAEVGGGGLGVHASTGPGLWIILLGSASLLIAPFVSHAERGSLPPANETGEPPGPG